MVIVTPGLSAEYLREVLAPVTITPVGEKGLEPARSKTYSQQVTYLAGSTPASIAATLATPPKQLVLQVPSPLQSDYWLADFNKFLEEFTKQFSLSPVDVSKLFPTFTPAPTIPAPTTPGLKLPENFGTYALIGGGLLLAMLLIGKRR